MAGKKDYAVVSVVSGLTRKQASLISSAIMNAKEAIAPFGRGTAAVGKHSIVGSLLQKGTKKIGGK